MNEIRFDSERQVMWLVISGALKASDFERTLRELARHPALTLSTKGIADLRGVDSLELSGEEVRAMVDFVEPLNETFRGMRWAVLAPSDPVFGITRQFQLMNEDAPYEMRSFHTLAEAERWLEESA